MDTKLSSVLVYLEGAPLTIDLKNYEITTDYRYYAAPKLDPEAFLVANLTGWRGFQLLEGMANLFVEGAFQGETVFDPRVKSDTLILGLGRDRNVQVSREPIEKQLRPRFFAAQREESRAYQLSVTNRRSEAIQITMVDQIPLSPRKDVEVVLVESAGADLEEKSGILSWELTVPSQETLSKGFRYKVRFPKQLTYEIE